MPFAGGSIMGHAGLFYQLQGYDLAFDGQLGEDYDLLLRAAEITDLAASPEPLYFYRTNNPDSMYGLIHHNYSVAKELVLARGRSRASRLLDRHQK